MRDQLLNYKKQIEEIWSGLGKQQKMMIIVGLIILIFSLILIIYWATKPEYVEIYRNLSPAEAGEIKMAIEDMGIPVEITADGRSILVPKANAPHLKVELAHMGIPRSGSINYSRFSENMGFGMTDLTFDVVHRDAMQTEISYLIESIDGIERAQVMITLPKESIWLMDQEQSSTAAVMITTRPGMELTNQQINGLYHLISKMVPNLSTDNIEIMNQHWQSFELVDTEMKDSTLTLHQQQRQIKKDIEKDIQRELQQMLGTILGMNNVIVSVFANVDFTQERREEQLVQPVDEETKEGIAISIQRLQESFVGTGDTVGGIPGTGDTDIPGYPGQAGGQESEYEKVEEIINREVNRIYRQIDSSPYLIKDLSVNVGIDTSSFMLEADEDQAIINQVESIISNIVRTSLSTSGIEMDNLLVAERIHVFENNFHGRVEFPDEMHSGFPAYLFAVAAAVLLVGFVGYAVISKRRKKQQIELDNNVEQEVQRTIEIEDYDFDKDNQKVTKVKRLERLAKNNPDDFAKLLKSWIEE